MSGRKFYCPLVYRLNNPPPPIGDNENEADRLSNNLQRRDSDYSECRCVFHSQPQKEEGRVTQST